MFLLKIKKEFGANGGKRINGDIDVVSRKFEIVTVQDLLVLRWRRNSLI